MSTDDKYAPKGEIMIAPENKLDMKDELDRRRRATANDKLEYLCEKGKETFGHDPRGGGFCFVAKPDTVEELAKSLSVLQRQMQRTIVVGQTDSDVVCWWSDGKGMRMPVRVRFKVKDRDVWLVPESVARVKEDREDRRLAAEIRMRIARNTIKVVS